MAQVQSPPPRPQALVTSPRLMNAPRLSPTRSVPAPLVPQQPYKSGQVNFDTFSPVDENGSFRFDRMIKSGRVNRRTKKKGAWKPSWKSTYIVLRPNLLSIYQDEDETGFRASIALSDITAVAPVRKSRTKHVFGIFTPSKNYHFQGQSEQDTADWIAKLRLEATIGEQDQPPAALPQQSASTNHLVHHGYDTTDVSADEGFEQPGSPEMNQWAIRGQAAQTKTQGTRPRRASGLQDYSGNEMLTTSYSDFSDAPQGPTLKSVAGSVPKVTPLSPIASVQQLRPPIGNRTISQVSITNIESSSSPDPERVVRQGWLQVLRTKTGVKAWKTMWCVLRPKNLCFYKNEQEYSTLKLLPMSSVIDAADVDPISRTKKFCFQVIFEDKTYRFCAANDEQLAKWLGALKSVITKRAEVQKAKTKAWDIAKDGVDPITQGTEAITIR